MSRVAYVPCINEHYQSLGFPAYRWSVFDSAPWTPLKKPLGECRIALLSGGGISLKSQPPYDPKSVNDFSLREIPRDAGAGDFVINYSYYDHVDADKDINCVFPIERFRELEAEGFIGELAPVSIATGMGRMYKRSQLQNEIIPGIFRRLEEEKVDALFLIAA